MRVMRREIAELKNSKLPEHRRREFCGSEADGKFSSRIRVMGREIAELI